MRVLRAAALVILMIAAPDVGRAQAFEHTSLLRALALEDSAKWNESIVAYRQALTETGSLEAVFGLERVYAMVGRTEAMIQLLDSLITRSPRVQAFRVMQLRTFRLLNDPGSARLHAAQWMRELPDDPEAYRQLFAHAALTPTLAREIARNIERAPAGDSVAIIREEFGARLATAGLWSLARDLLEREWARGPNPAIAARLALVYARSGDLDKARSFARAASVEDDTELRGWLALYEGDFAGARVLLAVQETPSALGTAALSYLARTRVARLPDAGAAFLSLARADTTQAIPALLRAAAADTASGSLLMAIAARLLSDQAKTGRAAELWSRITTAFPRSPEAPEALLQHARILARAGRQPEAIGLLERLILEYSGSALVAQARRELEVVRSSVPPRG